MAFVHFQGESLVQHHTVVVTSGPHEASVMRNVARAPTFIQLESKDKLSRVEGVVGFGKNRIMLQGRSACTWNPFNSIAGCIGFVVPFVASLKPNKPGSVRHHVSYVAINRFASNTDVMSNSDLYSQRRANFQNTRRNHGYFEKGGIVVCACVECELLGCWCTRTVDIWRMRLQPSRSHGLMVNHFSLWKDA